MKFAALLVLLCLSYQLFSQKKISGVIKNGNNQAVANASVTVKSKKDSLLLAYDITDANGNYILEFGIEMDSVILSVAHLSYTKIDSIIPNTNSEIDLIVQFSITELKEVRVNYRSIAQAGDTIKYSVGRFKNTDDRVISDIISRLPGIEVEGNGTIKYQGKPIKKYYIEGLDLLEGRYNLASQNIPADAVDEIQILENHQPIRILDSLVFEDQSSLNISLKNNVVFTGSAKAGVGYGVAPILWEANLTPMLFSGKRQMIATYQSNNIGLDLSSQLSKLSFDMDDDKFDNSYDPIKWLNIIDLNTPNFSERRWKNNKSHLLNGNYLQKLSNGFELKFNAGYDNQWEIQEGLQQTRFFLNDTTTLVNEDTNNSLQSHLAKGQMVLEKNTTKTYFKNDLQFDVFLENKAGNISSSAEQMIQRVQRPFSEFQNDLKWIFPFKENLLTAHSVIKYRTTSQNLNLIPGVLIDDFNNGDDYNVLRQDVNSSNLYQNHSLSISKNMNQWTIIPKVGLWSLKQNMNSSIAITEDQVQSALPDVFANDITFNKMAFYGATSFQYKPKGMILRLNLPVQFRVFKRVDEIIAGNSNNFSRFVPEPTFYLNKSLNSFWNTFLRSSYKKSFGSINRLFSGFIVENYRKIRSYDAPIAEKGTTNFNVGVAYSNPLQAAFFNIYYDFNYSSENILYANMVTADGSQVISAKEQPNSTIKHSLNTRISRYLSKFNSTFALNVSASLLDQQQLINTTLQNNQITNLRFNPKIDAELAYWAFINLNSNLSFYKSYLSQEQVNNFSTQSYLAALNIFLTSDHQISIETEYLINDINDQIQNYSFLNTLYTYRIKKKKIDIVFRIDNILNVKEFTTIINNPFYLIESNFNLRSRQYLVNINLTF